MIIIIFIYLLILFIKKINNFNLIVDNLIVLIILINLLNCIEWIYIFCNFNYISFSYGLIILTL